MLELRHGDFIRLNAWDANTTTVEVCTVRGYASERKADPDHAEERAIERGHALAWSYMWSTCLYGDTDLANRDSRKRREAHYKSRLLEVGQHVMIEGRQYEVICNKFNNRRYPLNSDPVSFKPV